MRAENGVKNTSSDDCADDRETSESDASQVMSTTHESDSVVSMTGTNTSRPQMRGRGHGRAHLRGRGRGRTQSRGRGHGRGQARGQNQRYAQLLPACAKSTSVNYSHFVGGDIFSPAREVGPRFSIDDSLTELNLFSEYLMILVLCTRSTRTHS